jgi:tRNA (guanine37-N1)-methyltransferase
MRFDVVSLFPEMFSVVRDFGVTGRAVERGIVELALWNPRDYAHDRHRSVDDRPYGGGPGMVMMIEPLRDAIRAARVASPGDVNVIALSPQGRPLDQAALRSMATRQRVILVAGRYEGIDERLIEMEVDEEYSIGDYVLSGGELAAMVLIDGVTRLLPGVLGHEDSAQQDSFGRGLLDCPHYTRPEEFEGRRVPDVLLSGNHAYIARWRLQQALGRTWQRRPELLEGAQLSDEERDLLAAFLREQQRKAN